MASDRAGVRRYAPNETVLLGTWLSATAEDAPTPDAPGALRSPPLLPEAYRSRCQPAQGALPREAADRQNVPDKQVGPVPGAPCLLTQLTHYVPGMPPGMPIVEGAAVGLRTLVPPDDTVHVARRHGRSSRRECLHCLLAIVQSYLVAELMVYADIVLT